MADDEDYEKLAHQQKLKAAVHYTTGQICEEFAEEEEVTYSRQFIAAVTEAAYKQIQSYGRDLELFARHAKRMTIQPDDVKLLVRKTPQLHEYISQLCKDDEEDNGQKKKRGKSTNKGGKKKTSSTLTDTTNIGEDSSESRLFQDS
ncbi:centromere protein S [Lingula anatina]|uniref:Centromere protein S n=1 Tax=Lingula anatina TaxID=7574 RepID=A0A1S3JWX0_LINAN|nr:centromere protein S [Lingula anatina]|eukprot:XP_013414802.1 centromere protein S [Lingula anatina]